MSGSSRRARSAAPEVEDANPGEVVEYMQADADMVEANGMEMPKNDVMMSAEDEEKKETNYINLPKLTDPMPDFESKTHDQLREWLREHGVKGTWSKKLLPKCKDVWDDMLVQVRENALTAGIPLDESMNGNGNDEEEPDFAQWTPERKRTFLRRRDVKGIWEKYLSEKCSEIWRLEKAGEKYIHTPPSLGRSSKGRFPGQSMVNVGGTIHLQHALPLHLAHIQTMHSNLPVITNESTPLSISHADFSELAGAAQKSDLQKVTDLLNTWSSKNKLPEEPAGIPVDDTTTHSTGEGIELRWVHSEVTPSGVVRSSKVKRSNAKRKRAANGQAVLVEEEVEYMNPDELNGLQARIRELEAMVDALKAENATLKRK